MFLLGRSFSADTQLGDPRDKLVTPTAEGLDGVLQLAAVAQSAAGTFYVVTERGIGNLAPVPHLLEQLIPGQHSIAMPDQIDQQVEHLGFDGNDLAAAGDPKQRGIDRVIAHPIFWFVSQGVLAGTRPSLGKHYPIVAPSSCAAVATSAA